MHGKYLDKNDYKNLLDFSRALITSEESYLDNLLSLINEYFGWSLSLYNIVDRKDAFIKPTVRAIKSITIEPFLLNQLKELYSDETIVYNYIENKRRSNVWNGVFFSQEMDEKLYAQCGYNKVFSRLGIKYTAACYINMTPEIKIDIFKTESEGPFTAREKELLHQLRNIVCTITKEKIRSFGLLDHMEMSNRLLDINGIGRLITDGSFHDHHYNSTFMSIAAKHFKSVDLQKILESFLGLFGMKDTAELKESPNYIAIRNDSIQYSIRVVSDRVNEFEKCLYEFVVQPLLSHPLSPDYDIAEKYNLTNRELQILKYIVDGYSNKEISELLHISMHTVKSHITKIFAKLNVENRLAVYTLFNK